MFLSRIEELFPEFNQRSHMERDAIEFCRANKVYIVDDKKLITGKYTRHKDYDFILINPKLFGNMRLWVLWHEIAHYIFHAPLTSRFSSQMKRKNEKEANNFAAVMMMPKPVIETRTLGELLEDYPLDLIQIRKEICDGEKM